MNFFVTLFRIVKNYSKISYLLIYRGLCLPTEQHRFFSFFSNSGEEKERGLSDEQSEEFRSSRERGRKKALRKIAVVKREAEPAESERRSLLQIRGEVSQCKR